MKKQIRDLANKFGYDITKIHKHENLPQTAFAAPGEPVINYPYLRNFNIFGNKFQFFIAGINGKEYYDYDNELFESVAEPKSILSILEPNDHVLEIGAHNGFYTTLMATFLKQGTGSIIALEAFPLNSMIAASNIGINQLSNARILNAAGSDKKGIIEITNDPNCSVVEGDEASNKLKVEAMSIDEICAENPNINFIKIDVEGYEETVLKGAVNLLKKAPKIELEVHNANHLLQNHGGDLKRLLQMIDYKRYKGRVMFKADTYNYHDVDFDNLPTEEDFNLFLMPK
ncbi:MAG: FkbM family methyltransferase [Candidatus Dojkabacteria bacterium]